MQLLARDGTLTAVQRRGVGEAALTASRWAVSIEPRAVDSVISCGMALIGLGRSYDEAAAYLQRAQRMLRGSLRELEGASVIRKVEGRTAGAPMVSN